MKPQQALDLFLLAIRQHVDAEGRIHALERRVAHLEAERELGPPPPPPPPPPPVPAGLPEPIRPVRLSPEIIRAHRRSLDLTQLAYARLVGVSGNAVGSWEVGRAKPNRENRIRLARVMRMSPEETRRRIGEQNGPYGNEPPLPPYPPPLPPSLDEEPDSGW